MEADNYQYNLLKRLPCPRFSGTQGEYYAAQLLQKEITSLGGESELMPFDIPAYEIQRCILTANGETIDCAAIGHSGQLPEGGLELPLKYLESASETAFRLLGDVSGCAVLINTLDVDMYRELVRRKAAAIIQIEQGKWYGVQALLSYEMRPRFLNIGHIPTVTIRAGDAMKLISDCTASVHLELRQRSFTAAAHNVLATVEGANPEEAVVLTAHYDTTEFSPGAWDNGSGAVTLMYIYRHFLAHAPKRTMHFIWCGAEEQGLLGSKAYVAAHEAILPQLRLCYNLDSCGTILGDNCIDIAGSEALRTLTEHICEQVGFDALVSIFPDGSDSAVFASHGIPSVCPGRGHWTSCEAHTPWDRIETISPEKLQEMGDFSISYLEYFVNAEAFPEVGKISQELASQLSEMMH